MGEGYVSLVQHMHTHLLLSYRHLVADTKMKKKKVGKRMKDFVEEEGLADILFAQTDEGTTTREEKRREEKRREKKEKKTRRHKLTEIL